MTRYMILAAALAVAVPAVVYARSDRSDQASLAAGNYRVLTAAESARLVRFGKAVRACLIDRGFDVDPLVVTTTRISMRLESASGAAVIARGLTACGEQLGGPPPRSSLQLRDGEVLVYLPVRCLLDPKVVRSQTA